MQKNFFKCQYCERNFYLKDKETHLKQCNVKSYLSSNINKENDKEENERISQEENKNVNVPPSYNNHEATNFAFKMQFEEYEKRLNYGNGDSVLAKNLQFLEYNKKKSQLNDENNKKNKNINNYYNDGLYDMSEDSKLCYYLIQKDLDELSKKNNGNLNNY